MSDAFPDPQSPEPAANPVVGSAGFSGVVAVDAPQAPPEESGAAAAPGGEGVVRFGPSHRALNQRRILAVVLVGLILGLLWMLFHAGKHGALWEWLRWVLMVLLAGALWRTVRVAIWSPLAGREVLLHPQALELRREGFRRLIVFENIRHLYTVQNPAGRLWSLRFDLEDDSVTLRDIDGLARIFATAAQRRPAGTLIEVEERRVDWGEPKPWMLLVLALVLLAAWALALI